MNKTERIPTYRTTMSEAAIDGLFGGLWAGVAMGVVVIISGLWAGDTIWDSVGRFSPTNTPQPLIAVFTHLALSAVYGLIYAILTNFLFRVWNPIVFIKVIVGVLYGFLLWLLAIGVLLPVATSPLGEISLVMLAFAHLIYGLVLGLYMSVKVDESKETI